MPVPEVSGTGTPPDGLNAGLSSIGVMQRDVLKWFAAGTDAVAVLDGKLAVTLLDYDLPSNTHLVRIGSSPEPASPVPMGAKPRILLEPLPAPANATVDGVRMSLTAPATLKAELRLPRQRVTLMRGVVQPVLLAGSLVMVRLDVDPSIVLDLAVVLPAAEEGVQSVFEIDLSNRVPAGTYQIYLVIGDTVTGPIALTLKP